MTEEEGGPGARGGGGGGLTSRRLEEADDERVLAAGEQLVRLLGQLVLVLVAERFHVVLHLGGKRKRKRRRCECMGYTRWYQEGCTYL